MLWRDALGVGFLFAERGKGTSPWISLLFFLVSFSQGGGQAWLSRLGPEDCRCGTGTVTKACPIDSAALGPTAARRVHGEPVWIPNKVTESQHLCSNPHCQLMEGGCGAVPCVLANASFVMYVSPHTYMCAWRRHQILHGCAFKEFQRWDITNVVLETLMLPAAELTKKNTVLLFASLLVVKK